MRHPFRFAPILGSLLFIGCVEATPTDEAPSPPTTPAFGPNQPGGEPGDKDQSRWLLGATLDDALGVDPAHHVSVSVRGLDPQNRTATVTLDGAASLRGVDAAGGVHLGADPWFETIRLFGPAGGELRLDVLDSVNGVTTYELESRASSTAPWLDPCDGGTARVLAGSFTRTGMHEPTVDRITFACSDAVAAKCIDWGYRPGASPSNPGWLLHQTCTRMGRGDYCANGMPHTRVGTYIHIYDDGSINGTPPTAWPALTEWPPPHTEFYFEAAWRPDQPALCLSRLRWQSLPVGPQCGGLLKDPRQDVTAKYCDYQSAGALRALGAQLFNTSRYNDIKLDSWQLGADRVATVRGYNAAPGGEIPPQPAFSGYAYHHSVASLLRSLPAGHSVDQVRQVTMFQNATGDHVLGLSLSPPAGYAPIVDSPIEGWLLLTEGSDTVPLRMFKHPVTLDLVTDVYPPAGYVSQGGILGWALESE